MYVRMYVCMYVRMYVRTYLCSYVRMYICEYVRMYGWRDGGMDGWMDGCVYTYHYGENKDVLLISNAQEAYCHRLSRAQSCNQQLPQPMSQHGAK